MLVKGIMTTNVVTIPSNASIIKAKRVMKSHRFRRLPVVDKGKLVGIVTEDSLERVGPAEIGSGSMWELAYNVASLYRTQVKSIMARNVVTATPDMTVEEAVALAQSKRVGALVVVEDGRVVGIVTTNDFFYRIVNPILGIGESGTRILIDGGGDSKSAEKIINCINRLGVGVKLIWTSPSSTAEENDLTLQLDTENATRVIKELAELGYEATVRQR